MPATGPDDEQQGNYGEPKLAQSHLRIPFRRRAVGRSDVRRHERPDALRTRVDFECLARGVHQPDMSHRFARVNRQLLTAIDGFGGWRDVVVSAAAWLDPPAVDVERVGIDKGALTSHVVPHRDQWIKHLVYTCRRRFVNGSCLMPLVSKAITNLDSNIRAE